MRRTRQKALNQFECQVTATEGLFKEAEKSKRALKRAIRKAKKSSTLVSIPKAYSFAELRLSSELSVEDILKFNEKHQISEQNWLRKIAHLTGAEEEGINFVCIIRNLSDMMISNDLHLNVNRRLETTQPCP